MWSWYTGHWWMGCSLLHNFGTARMGLGGAQPAQTPHRCTKCNSPPINGQCTNHCMVLCGFNVGIKGLNTEIMVYPPAHDYSYQYYRLRCRANEAKRSPSVTHFMDTRNLAIANVSPLASRPITVLTIEYDCKFKTKSKEVASCCMEMFNCSLPSVSVNNRKCKFLQNFFGFWEHIIVLTALSSVF